MRCKKNLFRALSIASMLSISLSSTVFAGEWKLDDRGWWYQNHDGTYKKSGCQQIDSDNDGIAETYYFDENGYLCPNTRTVNGWIVNSDGMIVTADGKLATQQIYTDKDKLNYKADIPQDFPLQGKMDRYFCNQISESLGWKWNNAHFPCEACAKEGIVVPEGMSRNVFSEYMAVKDQDISYLAGLSGFSMSVLQRLSGYPITTLGSYLPEVEELAGEVLEFMNSFDWRNASDLEKATRICNRIHEASYDWDEAKNTEWSESLSYGAYGCLVKGKAVCQGYTEAATLLGFAVDLKTFELGDFNHTYPIFCVDGIWLANEPTTKDKYFTIADVYKYNGTYLVMLQAGDTSGFNDVNKYQTIGQYCIQTGYVMPDEEALMITPYVSKLGVISDGAGGKNIYYFKSYD